MIVAATVIFNFLEHHYDHLEPTAVEIILVFMPRGRGGHQMEEEEEGRWFGFSYHFDLTFYIIFIIKIKNDHYGVQPAARRRRSRRRRADILTKPQNPGNDNFDDYSDDFYDGGWWS